MGDDGPVRRTGVRFAWVDVFADRPLTGNPLALVPDADLLDEAVMAAIAREFNQSETTFIVRASEPTADLRLRSFTPGGVEVFGAGHNAMGAWIWLATTGALEPGRVEFVQQIGRDLLPVTVTTDTDARSVVAMRQGAPSFFGPRGDPAAIANALGLEEHDLAGPAEVVSTGVPHLLVPAGSTRSVDRARPRTDLLLDALSGTGAEGCYLYAVQGSSAAYARFFNPTVGIQEDPATGTAAGPLAALMLRDGDGMRPGTVRIEQGTALGRPSALHVSSDGSAITLTGSGAVSAAGRLLI